MHDDDDVNGARGDGPIGSWERLAAPTRRSLGTLRPREGCRIPDEHDTWRDSLTPLPLGKTESAGLRMLARAMAGPDGPAHAIGRYRFLYSAIGLGLGTDPEVVAGLRWALIGLERLRDATSPSTAITHRARH